MFRRGFFGSRRGTMRGSGSGRSMRGGGFGGSYTTAVLVVSAVILLVLYLMGRLNF